VKAIVFALALLSSPVFAADSSNETPPAQASNPTTQPAKDPNRMVCERKKTLGSNKIERVCMTAAQKEAAREAARDAMLRGSRCADSSCVSN